MIFKNKSRKREGMMKFFRNKNIYFDPESTFIDSKNLNDFDQDKFEGVIENPIEKKNFLWILIFAVGLVLFFLYKTFLFQIVNGESYKIKSKANFTRSSVIFSDRGVVSDRNNVELIWNDEDLEEGFSKRIYIKKQGFSHLLGFLSYPQKDKSGNYFEKEYIGKGGIEKYFNGQLNGKLGEKIIEVNSIGKTVSDNIIKKPEIGKNLKLSIDVKLQEAASIALGNYIQKNNFVAGSALVMNINNGKIIVMTSLPEYESGVLTEGKDRKKIKEYLYDDGKPFLNKALYAEYTPGSIIKPFVALEGLKNNIITPKTKIFTNGKLIIPNKFFPDKPSVFRDWKNHGMVDLNKAIAMSSNVYFYLIGGGFLKERKGLGIEKLSKVFSDFGFGENTGIEGFGEKKGQIPTPEWKKKAFKDARPWNIGNTYYTAIGQFGFSVTPLQALVAVSSIANGGKIMVPKILLNSQEEVKNTVKFSDKNMRAVKKAMRETVLNGTTKSLNFDFVKIASKSGSAQIKNRTRINSWVIGFFPYNKPKYAFVFMAENGPKKTISGVAIGAADFFRIINENGYGQEYFSKKSTT